MLELDGRTPSPALAGTRFPTGEPYDCRMGCYVAANADLSLRLVAAAATEPDLYEAEPYARGTCPKRQKLSGQLDTTTAQL